MAFDDYLRRQRDLERILERTEFSGIRSIDAEIRKLQRPIHESLADSALGSVVRDVERMRGLSSDIYSTFRLSSALNLADTLEQQHSWYQRFLDVTKNSVLETSRLFTTLEETARVGIADFYAGSALQDVLYGDMSSIRDASLHIADPLSSAALATALTGWTTAAQEAYDSDDWALTNPLTETARFFNDSSRMLIGDVDQTTARAIERSLLLAEAQLRVAGDALLETDQEYDEPLGNEPTFVVPATRRLLVPRVQRLELRRSTVTLDEDADLDDVLASTLMGRDVLIAREVTSIFAELAELQMFAGTPIFRVTTRVARVCAELPFAVPVNRQTFADFIDDLYWLLYESPGSGSLRYLVENGGPFTRDDCEIVFVVKRLRNHYRHDFEHGSVREIQKKIDAIREDLIARGVQSLGSRSSYRTIYRALLTESLAFLQKLRTALTE